MTYTTDNDKSLAAWLGLPYESGVDFLAAPVPRPICMADECYLTAPTPASDYAVLEAVRKKGPVAWALFHHRLRNPNPNFETQDPLFHYEPGHFADAAWAAKEQSDGE